MNPMYHPSYPALRHQELIDQSEELRRRSTIRRLARAARMTRRAESLSRRASEIVDLTHQ